MSDLPRLVVAGTHSGVGKTSVATGLMAAFAARGRRVAAFKVGPDYIDPSYHRLATGGAGRNLDAVLSGPDLLAPLFAHGAAGADLAVIEGVMGLFDGAARTPGDVGPIDPEPGSFASTAHVALLLTSPVVLVVDAAASARSLAALVHGFATFDPRLRLAGVVANRVASDRHAELVAEAVRRTGVPLLGMLRRDARVATPDRHLGLVPAAERADAARTTVDALGAWVTSGCDLAAIERSAASPPPLRARPWQAPVAPGTRRPIVAVAGGPAFTFTYPENLEVLTAAGANVAALDPTRDTALPAGTAALVLGGGFPEVHAGALTANAPLRGAVAAFAAAGGPIVAECGGLAYLAERLDGHPMCGVLPAAATLGDRLHLGYREATAVSDSVLAATGWTVAGHEFHYSTLEPAATEPPAWRFADRAGGRGEGHAADPAGTGSATVHASYLHTHWASRPELGSRLVAAASRWQARQEVPA